MSGSEFRLLPRLPLEYKTYKLIVPTKLGRAMTAGWTPVAAVNYTELGDDQVIAATRFLIGKDLRTASKAGPTPVLMYQQPEDEDDGQAASSAVQQMLDRIALMSQEELLTLHAELQQQHEAHLDEEDDEEVDEVQNAMSELLGDDGSEDDDD
jgi:hypothetical protein